MIQLHTDCLVFETSDGEAIPCSAHDVTVELLGDAVTEIEPHLITEAAEAVLFQTIKLCLPLLSKFKAIGTAMIPAPRKPIVFVV